MMSIQWWRVTFVVSSTDYMVLEIEGRVASSSVGASMVGEVFSEFRTSWEKSGWKFEKVEGPHL